MNRGAFNNLFIAHAQVWGMLLALCAMIYFLAIVLTGHAKLDATTEKLAYTMFGVFAAKFGDMIAYLYNRQRPGDSTVLKDEVEPKPDVPSPLVNQPENAK